MYSEKVTSIKGLEKAAKQLLEQFPGQRVFAFYGKMGAGKTSFIQAICRVLDTPDNVTSPTFAIINEYATTDGHVVFHFDFYRIKDLEEAYDLGYEDYFYSGSYCLIEWPEKIESLLPQSFVRVDIEVLDDGKRLISAKNFPFQSAKS
jgi:tRNA threonylcarbamoyladenosine biosynthesis protein TsaE